MGSCISIFVGNHQVEKASQKILVIGTGSSGKSTFLKQLKILFMGGYTADEVRLWRELVFSHVIFGMQELLSAAVRNEVKLETVQPEVEVFTNRKGDFEFGQKEVQAAKVLWGRIENMTQDTFYQGNLSFGNMEYFMERLDDMLQEDYLPNDNDILRARQRTAGISQLEFDYNSARLNFIDCGGQQAEREKWPLVAPQAICCLYLTSLPNYDTPLPTNPDKTILDESLEVWENVTKSEHFRHCGLILFLNKSDLFAEKVAKGGFKEWFPDFNGEENNPGTCGLYIEGLFRQCLNDRALYTHITCAIDTEMVQSIFNAIVSHIFEIAITKSGIV